MHWSRRSAHAVVGYGFLYGPWLVALVHKGDVMENLRIEPQAVVRRWDQYRMRRIWELREKSSAPLNKNDEANATNAEPVTCGGIMVALCPSVEGGTLGTIKAQN